MSQVQIIEFQNIDVFIDSNANELTLCMLCSIEWLPEPHAKLYEML